MAKRNGATRIGVLGAGGRMGRTIIELVRDTRNAVLAGAVEKPGHPAMGEEIAPSLVICGNTSALAHSADVLVDFTTPDAIEANLTAACDAGCGIVIGTTGLAAKHHSLIDEAAKTIAVLQTANTSLGVAMLAALVAQAAARLGPDWDIEIVETHHRHKIDAPSGTALMLGEAAARARGVDLDGVVAMDRARYAKARKTGDIGFASVRGGSVAGDHLVVLATDGERLELGHRAESRVIFARGAVRAALWLAGRPAGRYAMPDVLGL
jgi:4-hydroxy-tetrahydrodipicolinate reductase